MSWVIRRFETEGDALVEEVQLDDHLREEFRRLLDLPAADPLFDSFRLSPAVVKNIARWLRLPIQTDDGEYFLDWDA